MGGVPLNTFKQIKEGLKSIFKRKKKGDKTKSGTAEQPQDTSAETAAPGAEGTTEPTTTTQEAKAPAPESQGISQAAPTAAAAPGSEASGISPGTSIPEQGTQHHEAPAPVPLPQIPPIETTTESTPAAPSESVAGPAEPAKPEAK